ncbi:diaminobutyrate--2-oxoglutarate transaminase [Marinomonas mediterranea]|jgi:diaminobutyrate aminotransferase apoenzyme (EC 2.6.1.76)|uniref:2,4-diaminobutyrate 4-transaminase n=1 Tax=Marinomonas mediterranea (strain ATCC 700492 / JCM 21426 / NBRC 103028 / MMB-1) TaxID=717774 RepID=F2K4C7_MARM1|nr:diaminobutyrate--2-oxoglutarate transaminase [Marinomonas mediterranea]ADZ90226.1 2,4-diaminobutyrate 4-transaminase [Marinomonas mediterranea MMB-1]WCN16421.1 diaminobutyrate--2-oxoglutarate transaminase family protein [Marinomonas mediterranea MMB-1]
MNHTISDILPEDKRPIEVTASTKKSALSLSNFLDQPSRTLSSSHYLERQKKRESNARSYPRRLPLTLVKSNGVYLQDSENQIFIDGLAAAGTLALGHNHPDITAAITKTLNSGMPLQTLDITTPVKERFIDSLFQLLPSNMSQNARVQFCSPCGADAVEAAIKLAKTVTGRNTILAFSGAYHGMTQGTLAIMGNLGPKSALGTTVPDVQFMPYPYAPRCPYGIGKDGVKASLNQLETMLTDPESGVQKPAAIILEAVQGEAGAIPADNEWLKGLRALTKKHDILLIIDEVQAGMGRTGEIFAFQHANIEPDIIVLSKAIGGGLPMAVIVYQGELDQWQPGAHAGTFRGNQLALASGQVVMRHLLEENLHHHAGKIGARLKAHLQNISSAIVGDVRGRGLMLGVEIVNPLSDKDSLGNHQVDGDQARAIQQEALKRGLILELGGRFGSTVRFLPPLIINEDEIDVIAERFSEAVHLVAARAIS